MSKFLLLNFKDFGLNQDITKTIQSRALMCVCCLAKDVPFINLVTCSHSEILDKFLQNYELKPMYQVACLNCHAILKNMKIFYEQVDTSFKLLMSETTTDHPNTKVTNLSCHKTVDLYLPQLDSETDPLEQTDSDLAQKRLTNIQTGLDILKRNMDNLGVITKGIEMFKNLNMDTLASAFVASEVGSAVQENSVCTSSENDVHIDVPSIVNVKTESAANANDDVSPDAEMPNPIFVDVKTEPVESDNTTNAETPVETTVDEPIVKIEIGNTQVQPAESEFKKPLIETITLSKEEFLEEKAKLLKAEGYLKFRYKCEHCIVGFNYKENVLDHMKRKHWPKVGSATCELCDQTVYPPGGINAHMFLHYTRYKCSLCSKIFPMYNEALDHYRKVHNEGKHTHRCKTCSFSSISLNKLKRHTLRHQELKCRLCDFAFTSALEQRRHLMKIHNIKPTTQKMKKKNAK